MCCGVALPQKRQDGTAGSPLPEQKQPNPNHTRRFLEFFGILLNSDIGLCGCCFLLGESRDLVGGWVGVLAEALDLRVRELSLQPLNRMCAISFPL